MKTSSPRRAAFAALLLAPVLAACGFNAQTDQVYQPATGVNDRDGSVDVLNALIVSAEDGSGTFVATLVNNDQSERDELTGVTGDGVTARIAPKSDPIEVPADGLANLAESGAVTVTGEAVKAGDFVSVTLTFASGQSTTVKVPVVLNGNDYVSVPLPRSSESAKPSEEPTEEPTGEPTDEHAE